MELKRTEIDEQGKRIIKWVARFTYKKFKRSAVLNQEDVYQTASLAYLMVDDQYIRKPYVVYLLTLTLLRNSRYLGYNRKASAAKFDFEDNVYRWQSTKDKRTTNFDVPSDDDFENRVDAKIDGEFIKTFIDKNYNTSDKNRELFDAYATTLDSYRKLGERFDLYAASAQRIVSGALKFYLKETEEREKMRLAGVDVNRNKWNELMTKEELCSFLDVSSKTLNRMLKEFVDFPFFKVVDRKFFVKRLVVEYLERKAKEAERKAKELESNAVNFEI